MPSRIWRCVVLGLLLVSACFVSRLGAQQSPSQKLIVDSKKGELAAVEQDLANGADARARDSYGTTALMEAAPIFFYTHVDARLEITRILLDHGADVNAQDKFGRTALMYALTYYDLPLGSMVISGRTKMVKLLLEHGADPNATDHDGDSAYDRAVECEPILAVPAGSASDQAKVAPVFSYRSLNDKGASNYIPEEDEIFQMLNLRTALTNDVARLKQTQDDCLRAKIIKLATLIAPLPPIPEDARGHMITGETLMKGARGPQDFNQAIAEFKEAVSAAPWWGATYRDLSVAEETAGDYLDAKIALEFYLDTNPPTAVARAAQDRIYKLDGKLKLAGNQ